MVKRPKQNGGRKLTGRERRTADRDEYKAALKEFTSFHSDNVTRERRRSAERLEAADRRLNRWFW